VSARAKFYMRLNHNVVTIPKFQNLMKA